MVSSSESAAALGPRGETLGAATFGGVPADCIGAVALPAGPGPTSFVAMTETVWVAMLFSPPKTAWVVEPGTTTCAATPLESVVRAV